MMAGINYVSEFAWSEYVCLSSVWTLVYFARYTNGENNQAEHEGESPFVPGCRLFDKGLQEG